MYHDLKVDGVSLKGYKVYINGTGAYDSAERDIEMIEIPGRDGAFALDKKRFKNITVQYNSGTFAENQPEFARKISDLRNFLASKRGYVRIEDDYNPDEYRMGVFSRGLEFDPVCYNMASEFPIEFNCKPQRFLKIGDLPVSVASGDVLTNPTLFDAHPLIKFNASTEGSISIGDRNITFLNAPLGVIPLDINVLSKEETFSSASQTIEIANGSSLLEGDELTIRNIEIVVTFESRNDWISITRDSASRLITQPIRQTSKVYKIYIFRSNLLTPYKTAEQETRTVTLHCVSETESGDIVVTLNIQNTASGVLEFNWTISTPSGFSVTSVSLQALNGTGDSSKNAISGDIYADLDIGEAYKIEDGVATSLNNFINLGSELPTLPPGSTTISYSNTISNVEITPRWWRV